VPVKAVQTPTTTEVPQVKPVEQKDKTELVPAGRIQFCLPAWEQITQDPWVLEVVKGYQLKLVQIPSQIIPVTSVARPPSEHNAIKAEIQALLEKGAVRKGHTQSNQFTSTQFVIPKKDRSLCLVINLKPLNTYMANQHFKMDGIYKVEELLREGDWMYMCKIDLKDVYLSVAIAEHHRKFVWQDTTYEFTSMSFGLCSAPRIFTKLFCPMMAYHPPGYPGRRSSLGLTSTCLQ